MKGGLWNRVFLRKINFWNKIVGPFSQRCIQTEPKEQGNQDRWSRVKENILSLHWKRFFKFLAISGVTLAASITYLEKQKEKEMLKKRQDAMARSGIGGSFELMDPNGKTVSSKDLLGNWLLIYFGFTHCPDICPDEMQKMCATVDLLEAKDKKVIPVFISIDPERDTPAVVGSYAKEFSPKVIALTGSTDQIQETAKSFRVYHSKGPKDDFNDYIVDHTIITYLINPEGMFVDYYGNRKNAEQMMTSILNHMKKYELLHSKSWFSF